MIFSFPFFFRITLKQSVFLLVNQYGLQSTDQKQTVIQSEKITLICLNKQLQVNWCTHLYYIYSVIWFISTLQKIEKVLTVSKVEIIHIQDISSIPDLDLHYCLTSHHNVTISSHQSVRAMSMF